MAFVNPEILQKIFGGAQQFGQTLGSAPQAQQQQLHQALMGAGAGMSQAAAQPGANFGQALGGGAQGMMQGQQNAQQMQMNQMKMQQAQAEMERQERIRKMLGDNPSFVSQVATGPVQQPQIGPAQTAPYQQEANVQATRFAGPPDAQRWEALFPDLKANVIRTESGGRQFGDDGQTLTSSAGAQGLMQIMPGTGPDAAELAGLPWDPERMANDPKYNEQLGTAYLNHLGGRYSGDPVLASAAYNWGMGRVDSHIDKVGDPRKGEISHEDWVRSIPVEEARNYAASVGLPLVQGGGQSQAQPAAQPQQAPQQQLNGYQQRELELQANNPFANLPAGARQMLAAMDPDTALKAAWDMQTGSGQDTPARIQEAQMIAQQTGEPVGTVLARMRDIMPGGEDDLTTTTRTRIQQADMLMQADPGLDQNTARNISFGRYKVSRNPVTGQADVIDVASGRKVGETTDAVLATQGEEEVEEPDVDASQAFGAPAVIRNFQNTIFDMLGKDLPQPQVEDAIRRVTSLGIQGDVLLSEQFTGRVSNQLLDMIGQLKAKPATFFEGPARGKTSLEEMRRLIDRDLDRQRRVATDEAQGPRARQQARAAVEALTDYRGELDSVLSAWGSFDGEQEDPREQGRRPGPARGAGGQPPEGWSQELWDQLTDEEKAQLTGGE